MTMSRVHRGMEMPGAVATARARQRKETPMLDEHSAQAVYLAAPADIQLAFLGSGQRPRCISQSTVSEAGRQWSEIHHRLWSSGVARAIEEHAIWDGILVRLVWLDRVETHDVPQAHPCPRWRRFLAVPS